MAERDDSSAPPTWERRDMFGGRGAVVVRDLLRRREAAPFKAVLDCTLEAGGSVGRHRQQLFAEIIVGVGGVGEATVDGVPHSLREGEVVHLPLGSWLTIRNLSGDVPLRYMIIKSG